MKPLKLPALRHTDSTEIQQKLDIDYSLNNCVVGDRYFYVIENVSEYKEGDFTGSEVVSGGEYCIVPIKIDQLLDIIDKWHKENGR